MVAGKEAGFPGSRLWETDTGLWLEEPLAARHLPLGQGRHLGLGSERHRLGLGVSLPACDVGTARHGQNLSPVSSFLSLGTFVPTWMRSLRLCVPDAQCGCRNLGASFLCLQRDMTLCAR